MTCIHSVDSNTHTSIFTEQSWPIFSPTDCNTRNGIYTISCTLGESGGKGNILCRKEAQYVGMTTQPGKKRFDLHRSSAKLCFAEATNTVGKHYSLPGHNSSHMRFLIIEEVRSSICIESKRNILDP